MRKVELTMTEQVIYEIVKDFVDHRSRYKKAIHDIWALSFAYFSVLAFVKRLLPPNSLIPRSIMTHPRTSVRNGKWMVSMCLLLVTRQTRIDTSSNTWLLTRLKGSALSTPMRSNRAILHATSSAGRSLTSGICRRSFKPITALSSLTLLKNAFSNFTLLMTYRSG